MKKLKLNLDEIKVESFVIDESQNGRGTINGQMLPCDTNDPCGSGGGGGGSTNPQCSDIFCTQGAGCPTNYQYPSCYFTCFTCATNCGSCVTDICICSNV